MKTPTQIARETAIKLAGTYCDASDAQDFARECRFVESIILTTIQQATGEGASLESYKRMLKAQEDVNRGLNTQLRDMTDQFFKVSQENAAMTDQLAARDGVIARLREAFSRVIHDGWGDKPTLKEPRGIRNAREVIAETPDTYADSMAEALKARDVMNEVNKCDVIEKRALRTALAKAEEDTRRLDWLENEAHTIEVGASEMTVVRGEDGYKFTGDTLRSAIDSAASAASANEGRARG